MTRAGAIRLAVIAAGIGLIELLCQVGVISYRVLVPPSEMATTLWRILRSGEANADLAQTLSNVAIACVLAVVVGFGAGVFIHTLPRLRKALDPFLATYYAVPFFIFYPVLIFIFGVNELPMIVIGFMFAVVAMIISALNGLDRIPRVYEKVAAIHRMSGPSRALLIRLPAALPHLFTGVKLSVAYAFIGVIAAEFILAPSGLGYSIALAYDNFENSRMYALMLFILVLVTLVNVVLQLYEQRILARRGR